MVSYAVSEEEPAHNIDLSCFSGNLKRNENENARNCWRTSDGSNFKVRSKSFCDDKRKVSKPFVLLIAEWLGSYIPANFCSCPFNAVLKIPAGKHLMDLVAVDWFKDSKRIDHVARRKGCAAQVRIFKYFLCYLYSCLWIHLYRLERNLHERLLSLSINNVQVAAEKGLFSMVVNVQVSLAPNYY